MAPLRSALVAVGFALLLAPASGSRVTISLHEIPRQDALLEANATAAAGESCRWDQPRCCCQALVGDEGRVEVTCKRWTTGMNGGREVCDCGDVAPEALGFTSTPRSPEVFGKVHWYKLFFKAGKDAANEAVKTMEAQCVDPNTPVAFEGERPEGSCTVRRLWDHALPQFMRGRKCARTKMSKAYDLGPKLENSRMLNSFDPRLTHGSLMGCSAIAEGCAKLSWTDSILQSVLDSLDNNFLWIGSVARDKLMAYARQALVAEAGVDDQTAKLLLDWAFYHKEGTNAYCDPELMAEHRDMLAKGLTAEEPNHTVPVRPWVYTQEDVYKPFYRLLSMNIEGMFKADCKKERPPEVDEAAAREGEGLQVFVGEEERAAAEKEIKAASEKREFMRAHELQTGLDARSIAEPLRPFMDIPLIGTTLAYMQSPGLQHPIEAVEADLVRESLSTLGSLLSNETFVGHLKRVDGTFDGWEMPPELQGLWAKTKNARHGERIWEDGLVEELRKPSAKDTRCDCSEIEPNLALHMLNQLPRIGLDFGNVSLGSDGKLASDKATKTLEHVDLKGFARTMIMVEGGIQDPILATKYIAQKMLAGAEASGSKTGVPKISASGKVKGVLVGMPIVQNLWSVLERDEGLSTEVFAKKMKWFFVANIVWAVWHAIEANLPPEDIVLGLLTIAMSTLSNFAYDGKWITFTNSKPFTDYMLAVYTVWNYRFVKQWASEEKPEDQWMHVSVALSMPLIEALANHGDVAYYINYRRDDLFHAMLLMMERQQKEGKTADGRCCCDVNMKPSLWQKLAARRRTGDYDEEEMASSQRCVIVPHSAKTWRGKCPVVLTSKWPNIDSKKARMLKWRGRDRKYLRLYYDETACSDASKLLALPQSAFR